MLSPWLLAFCSIAYLGLLFGLAYWADNHKIKSGFKPWVYTLSLAVYCTSWSFYGTTAQAATNGWWLAPTYAGSMLIFFFAWKFYVRVATLCKTHNFTSISDLLASRYNQSPWLAGFVTLVATAAVIPYVSLQLKAATESFNFVTQGHPTIGDLNDLDLTLIMTAIIAGFAILFGTRRIRTSEHNPGLVVTIAFESIIKLVAFLAVGMFVTYFLFDGFSDLYSQASSHSKVEGFKSNAQPFYVYICHMLLGAIAMFCLPRQFHMAFIEYTHKKELKTARWGFPLYMLAINLFVLPIAWAGLLLFSHDTSPFANVQPELFVLAIPMAEGANGLTLFSYIGGFSAATSMAIVATIVLSIMVSNTIVTPFMIRSRWRMTSSRLNQSMLLATRRIIILAVLFFAYLYYQITSGNAPLANTGLIAMALVAQFAPALFLGLIWYRGNTHAAMLSISVGTIAWGYTLLLPTLIDGLYPNSVFLINGPWNISGLAPTNLLNFLFANQVDPIANGIIVSLSLNLIVYVLASWYSQPSIAERIQAAPFFPKHETNKDTRQYTLTTQDLEDLLQRFVGSDHEVKFKATNQKATQEQTRLVERELATVLGGASAKLVLDAATQEKDLPLTDVIDLVDEASDLWQFNRSLLQSTLQNIDQGISVVDKDLKLVAWNRRYIEMFDYPSEEIYIGRPVASLIRFNALRGLVPTDNLEYEIEKRVNFIRTGKPYKVQRIRPDGKVYEMQGNPLPGGGFVTTYTDITEFVSNQRALQEANESLERRVKERTQELEYAKQEAEQANVNKTRFFAAAGHDILQPFNAATLFCSLLTEKTQDSEVKQLANQVAQSLTNAEDLISSMLQLTKLDAGAIHSHPENIYLDSLLTSLFNQFQPMAKEKGIKLSYVSTTCFTHSDPQLLRRIIQNLLSNALRYTDSGEVLLGVRRHQDQLLIQCWDTGPGIPEAQQKQIFSDFVQLGNERTGLGLGLAIAKRLGLVMGHELSLKSILGKGSCFQVSVPFVENRNKQLNRLLDSNLKFTQMNKRSNAQDLQGTTLAIIDNDATILDALSARLRAWGCEVYSAQTQSELESIVQRFSIDLIVADYHIDEGVYGVEIVNKINQSQAHPIKCIINTADRTDELREYIIEQGYDLIYKPVKPAGLKRTIKKLIA